MGSCLIKGFEKMDLNLTQEDIHVQALLLRGIVILF